MKSCLAVGQVFQGDLTTKSHINFMYVKYIICQPILLDCLDDLYPELK